MPVNDKIEVFILTYNRCALLEQAIDSVIKQTVKTKLTVVDNHSTDGTVELVEQLRREGNEIGLVVREENGGWPGNFETARKLITHPYVLLFSDDDVLHPQYIETALSIFTKNPQLTLVCSACTPFFDDKIPDMHTYDQVKFLTFDSKRDILSYTFASQIIRPWETPLFPNVIYSRDYIENAMVLSGLYGKISDRPFILEGVGDGTAALIVDSMLAYRIHSGSDTANSDTACSHEELMRYMNYYYSNMRYSWESRLIYACTAGRNLKAYSNFTKRDRSSFKLLADAYRDGVIGVLSIPMLLERVAHILGQNIDGPFEHFIISIARSLGKRKVIALKGES